MREAIKLFWTFRVPWDWAYTAGTVTDWVAQFSFGFYSLMLTSLLLGVELFGAEGILYYAVAAAVSYMLSGYHGLYRGQKILYSKTEPTFINTSST